MKKFTLFIFLCSFSFLTYRTLLSVPQEISSSKQFQDRIVHAQTAVILFYAPWCNKSIKMKRHLYHISAQYPHIAVLLLDATKPELEPIVNQYGISCIPALISKEELNVDTQHLIKHLHAFHTGNTPPDKSHNTQKSKKKSSKESRWFPSMSWSRSEKRAAQKNKSAVSPSNNTHKRCN